MSNSITCPSCQTEIEITEVVRSQLTAEIRGELEAHAASQQAELDEQRKQLAEESVGGPAQVEQVLHGDIVDAHVELDVFELLLFHLRRDVEVQPRDRDEVLDRDLQARLLPREVLDPLLLERVVHAHLEAFPREPHQIVPLEPRRIRQDLGIQSRVIPPA